MASTCCIEEMEHMPNPIGSMLCYGNIYHHYTPNVTIYIHICHTYGSVMGMMMRSTSPRFGSKKQSCRAWLPPLKMVSVAMSYDISMVPHPWKCWKIKAFNPGNRLWLMCAATLAGLLKGRSLPCGKHSYGKYDIYRHTKIVIFYSKLLVYQRVFPHFPHRIGNATTHGYGNSKLCSTLL